MLKRILLASGLVFMLCVSVAFAVVTPEDFNAFLGSGFTPSPAAGQLDSDAWKVLGLSDGDMAFGETRDSGDFARGTSAGGVSTGGIYGFVDVGSPGNTMLGVQPGGTDFTPGSFVLRLPNETGAVIADAYISYLIWTFNNGDRSNSLNLAYSLDDSTYIAVPGLDFTTPEAADPTPVWVSALRTTTISSVNIPAGGALYVRWQGDDVSGAGSRDEYGIDDVEVRIGGPTAVKLSTFQARDGASNSDAYPGILVMGVFGLFGLTFVLRRRSPSPVTDHDSKEA